MGDLVDLEAAAALGRLASALREARGVLTQRALAHKMGCSARTIMRAESGGTLPSAISINLWLASVDAAEELRATVKELYHEARLAVRRRNANAGSASPATPGASAGLSHDIEDSAMHRATFLRGIAVTGAALLLPESSTPLATVVTDAPDASLADPMKRISREYRRLEPTLPAAELLGPVLAQLRLLATAVQRWPAGTDREAIAAAASEAAGLAGWLSTDLADRAAARRHYKRAVVFAVQTKSAALQAYMLGSAAAWSAADGDGAEAIRLVREARPFALVTDHPIARAWLAATEALAHAARGEQHAALEALDHAEDAVAGERDLPRWPWIYAFDSAKVEQYRATCYATLGLPNLAIPALRRSLDGLSPDAGKQRALLLASLAQMALLQREIDQCAALLAQAYGLGTATGSRRSIERVREVRVDLAPWESAAAVRALDTRFVETFLARPGASR